MENKRNSWINPKEFLKKALVGLAFVGIAVLGIKYLLAKTPTLPMIS